MKYLLSFILIIFSLNCFSAVGVKFDLKDSKIRQGSIADAKVHFDPDAVQKIQQLRGQTLADTIYLQDVSALMKKGDSFEADAKIIFIKVPESKPLNYKFDNVEVLVDWSDAEIVPTESAQGFLFGEFDAPKRMRLLLWAGLSIGLLFLIFLGWKLYHDWKKKNELKKRAALLRDELLGAGDYDQVVELWKNKHKYLKSFPHTHEPFKRLEGVLFKYQFKPTQTAGEKEDVLIAYREFRSSIEGGFRGV